MSDSALSILASGPGHQLVLEDDGHVIYAYVLANGSGIVGDLWLANHGPAPVDAPWTTGASPPFANPVAYLAGAEIRSEADASRFSASWDDDDECYVISFGDTPVGLLRDGSKPGWSRCVGQDGPLARTWT